MIPESGRNNARTRTRLSAIAALASLTAIFAIGQTSAAASTTTYSIYPSATVPSQAAENDTHAVELGVQFSVSQPGTVTAIRFYKQKGNSGTHVGDLWSASGAKLASVTFTGESSTGWQTANLSTPVALSAGQTYVASYHTNAGHYSEQTNAFAAGALGNGVISATKGTYVYGSGGFPTSSWQNSAYFVDVAFQPGSSATQNQTVTPPPTTSPTPTPTPTATPTPAPTPTPTATPTPAPTQTATPTPAPTQPPSSGPCASGNNVAGGSDPWGGCFPGPNNTGVPAGTTLSTYTGSATLSGNINGQKLVGDFAVSGSATITNSEIDGSIETTGSGTLSMTDVTLIGDRSNEQNSVIYGSNITGLRLNVSNGKANFQCGDHCTITDSWLHDQYIEAAYHYDAIGSNGTAGIKVEHNTISCTDDAIQSGATGGCSADMGFFGDFGVISNVNVDRNLFVASNNGAGYCVITNASKPGKAYPTGSNLSYTNNVWQKGANGHCGQYGAVDNWSSGNGNTWSGNTWDDGSALNE